MFGKRRYIGFRNVALYSTMHARRGDAQETVVLGGDAGLGRHVDGDKEVLAVSLLLQSDPPAYALYKCKVSLFCRNI